MEEKIKSIQEYFKFIAEFKNLLKYNPNTDLFNCSDKKFEKEYSVLYGKLKKYYKFVKNIELPAGCSNGFLHSFREIENLTLIQIIMIKNVVHKLVNDKSKVYWVDGRPYSCESPDITNQICEKIYKQYGAGAFEFFDKDWKSKEQLTAEKYNDVTNKENLKAFFKPEFTPVVEEKKNVEIINGSDNAITIKESGEIAVNEDIEKEMEAFKGVEGAGDKAIKAVSDDFMNDSKKTVFEGKSNVFPEPVKEIVKKSTSVKKGHKTGNTYKPNTKKSKK